MTIDARTRRAPRSPARGCPRRSTAAGRCCRSTRRRPTAPASGEPVQVDPRGRVRRQRAVARPSSAARFTGDRSRSYCSVFARSSNGSAAIAFSTSTNPVTSPASSTSTLPSWKSLWHNTALGAGGEQFGRLGDPGADRAVQVGRPAVLVEGREVAGELGAQVRGVVPARGRGSRSSGTRTRASAIRCSPASSSPIRRYAAAHVGRRERDLGQRRAGHQRQHGDPAGRSTRTTRGAGPTPCSASSA